MSESGNNIGHLLVQLFLAFARIGLFTFGGGYAMLSLIESGCVTRKQWITADEMTDMTVIAESTPGPIAINCATYVGWKQAGISGAVSATVGMVLPSFLIIFLLSGFLKVWLNIPWVAKAFQGIRVAVSLLILDAGITMLKKMPQKPLPMGIMITATLVMVIASLTGVRLSSVLLMAIAGLFSMAWYSLRKIRKEAGKT